jgi:hypothetical protein
MAELRAALHAAEEQVMEVREAQQKAERALTALQDRRAGDTEPVVRARRGRKPRAAFATSLVDADVMDDPTADDLALDDLAADDLAADDRALDDRAAHDMVPDDIVFAVGSLLQRGGDFAPLVERPRRGRKPKPKVVYEALPIADDDDGVVVVPGQSAAAKRSRSSDPAQPREPKAPREPKPIRWWLTPRAKKQR